MPVRSVARNAFARILGGNPKEVHGGLQEPHAVRHARQYQIWYVASTAVHADMPTGRAAEPRQVGPDLACQATASTSSKKDAAAANGLEQSQTAALRVSRRIGHRHRSPALNAVAHHHPTLSL